MKESNLKITLVKSRSGRLPAHCATLTGLGLTRLNQSVVRQDNRCVRGMIARVFYLVKVEKLKVEKR
jgi:large subunit ribosomal protein L30